MQMSRWPGSLDIARGIATALPDKLGVGQLQRSRCAEFAPDSGGLHAAEGRTRVRADDVVDEHHPGFDAAGEAIGPFGISAPDCGAEPKVSTIGEFDRLRLGPERVD